jgi:ABC-type nitrate/sulfonate/bicarbonate transport system substrate-binding protein
MYNRVSLYAPPNSDITSVSDLRGKTVAVPFGTAAQKMLLRSEQEAGLNPKTDVTNTNLGIYEQGSLVTDAQASKWGSIDAMAGFDPTPAIFEQKGLVKVLKTDRVVSVIVMSKTYIKAHPMAPKQFLTAFRQSYEYYRGHQSEANNWFIAESKMQVPEGALTASASIEPNIASDLPIRIELNDDDLERMQQTADFLFTQQLIKQEITIKDFVDQSYQQ